MHIPEARKVVDAEFDKHVKKLTGDMSLVREKAKVQEEAAEHFCKYGIPTYFGLLTRLCHIKHTEKNSF